MNDANVLSATVAAALRAPAGCPPLDRLAAAAHGELPEAERTSVLNHAASCPTCAAELDLARSFAGELPAEASAEGGDVAWVVERLRSTSASSAERPMAPVVPISSRRPAAAAWRGWAALAATLAAVGIGLTLTLPQRPAEAPPAVPSLLGDDVLRGGRIELESALGTLASAPERIAWRAVAGAVRYRLEIVGVDDAVVVGLDSAMPFVEIPVAERSRLETMVRYRIRVSAFDADGALVAASDPLELAIDPARR